jgi:uncharacterized repeat protein (TIGR03803 family)
LKTRFCEESLSLLHSDDISLAEAPTADSWILLDEENKGTECTNTSRKDRIKTYFHHHSSVSQKLIGAAAGACIWAASCFGNVTFTSLVTFNGINGAHPVGLIQRNDGNFYGATRGDTVTNQGKIFRVTPGGALTNLVALTTNTGEHPYAELIQGADGNLYGTTQTGGDAPGGGLMGTIFRGKP